MIIQASVKQSNKLKPPSMGSVLAFATDGSSQSGQAVRDSLKYGCEGLSMDTAIGLKVADTQPNFLLCDPSSIDNILEEYVVQLANIPNFAAIILCTDPLEKASVETRFSRQFSTIGWITEVVAQP